MCKRGFILFFLIVDINECVEDKDNCHEKANCTNIEGNFTCQCISGYTGDGRDCKGQYIATPNTEYTESALSNFE